MQPSFPEKSISAVRGSLLKVEGVLLSAASKAESASLLTNNPIQFLNDSGIYLTQEEYQALLDVICGTAQSPFATPPENAPFDKMAQLRELWKKSSSQC